jgi:hypothetical protein
MRIILADNQPKVRLALQLLLGQEEEISVVGEAANAEGLFTQIEKTHPDLAARDGICSPGRRSRCLCQQSRPAGTVVGSHILFRPGEGCCKQERRPCLKSEKHKLWNKSTASALPFSLALARQQVWASRRIISALASPSVSRCSSYLDWNLINNLAHQKRGNIL